MKSATKLFLEICRQFLIMQVENKYEFQDLYVTNINNNECSQWGCEWVNKRSRNFSKLISDLLCIRVIRLRKISSESLIIILKFKKTWLESFMENLKMESPGIAKAWSSISKSNSMHSRQQSFSTSKANTLQAKMRLSPLQIDLEIFKVSIFR